MSLPLVYDKQDTKTYKVNEVFYSLQGEGVRAGEPSIFVRLTGCNLKCNGEWVGDKETGVFQPICDTEFVSGMPLTLDALLERVRKVGKECRWIVLTGGEPGLQVDEAMVAGLHGAGYKLAIETNGTVDLSGLGLDWVTVSPKVAEHAIKQKVAHEVKYVRGVGQGIPRTVVEAQHHLISPAFGGSDLDREVLDWCIKLCLDNPPWRLSVQQHKAWMVR
jgi:7-carboxy-7-deazaguanine synthase